METNKEKIEIIFLGTPKISVSALKSLNEDERFKVILVITNTDKYFGRSRSKPKYSEVKKYCIDNNLPLMQTNNINHEYDKLKKIDFDYIITCAFGQFISDEILSLSRKKSLNIHASLLPEGRGGAPIHWAIINGKVETGISFMLMEKEMDSGEYFQQYKIKIDDNDTYDSLYEKLSTLIYDNTCKSIIEIDNGFNSIKQDESKVSKWLNIKDEDRIINWNQSAKNVHNQIRGLTSKPGAISFINGQRIKINKTNFDDKQKVLLRIMAPGKIFEITKNEIIVLCNPGMISITNITLPGKNATDVSSLVNGNMKIKEGDWFRNE